MSRCSGSEEAVGSWKSGDSLPHNLSFSRSFGKSLARTPEGVTVRSNLSSSSHAAVKKPLHKQTSIPKSESFVRQEGFAAKVDSPFNTPPASPQPRSLSGLLSRQLSTEGSGSLTFSFEANPTATAAINRLENTLRMSPTVPPSARPRSDVNPAELLKGLQKQYDVFTETEVVQAFNIAHAAHDGRYRESGEPAFLHGVEVARSLAGLGVDETTVAAALLHDVLDDMLLPEAQLKRMLANEQVFVLVKQVAHLGNISSMYRGHPASTPELHAATASSVVDMLVAMQHSRAVLVKLADRLHDMRTLSALPPLKRNLMAQETLDIWAPLANRVGLWNMKAPLEDLAFRQLHPADYADLRERLEAQQRPEALVFLVDRLRAELDKEGIRYTDLSGRPKHLYGVWQKLVKKSYTLDKICDVRGLRIIVNTKEECYRAQRIVERLWSPVGRSKDYIRNKKPNGYQSLHTVVRADDGHELEVQIRTFKMHYMAEYGDSTAHWLYKEGGMGGGCKTDNCAAKEASWAKFKVSQQINDSKYRPSGSPPRDVLASSSFDSDSSDSDAPHAKFDPRFLKFLERTGQLVQQPDLRTMVCVVCSGALDVHHLQPGTTVGQLLQRYGGQFASAQPQVVINRLLERNMYAPLHTGDTVDIYCEPAKRAVPVVAPAGVRRPQLLPHHSSGSSAAGRREPGVVVLVAGTGAATELPLVGGGVAPAMRNNMVSAAGLTSRLTGGKIVPKAQAVQPRVQ